MCLLQLAREAEAARREAEEATARKDELWAEARRVRALHCLTNVIACASW